MGKGGETMNVFDESDVISSYPLEQAVEDGVLVKIFKNRWKQLSGNKPIVATAHIFEEVSLAGLMEIWSEFVVWRRDVCPKLPDEERLFSTSMNSRKVWVI